MIYINNNTVEVIIPKTNTEYIQNRIVVTNQISKYSYEYHLTDFSTDNDCYIFKRPSFNCDDYIGSYDYQIFYNDILLDNGILLVEGLQPTGTTDKIEYEYKQTVIEYTPSIEYYPIVDRVKTITENGDYNVENYDGVKVNVLGGEVTDDEVNVLLEQLNALETEKTLLEGQVLELNREVEELSNTNATLSTENATLLAEKQQLLAQVTELIKSIEAQITDLNNRISDLQNDNAILENDLSNANNTIADLQEKVNSVTTITINEEGTYVAPEGVLGYNEIIVDIQEPVKPEFVPEYFEFYSSFTGHKYDIKYVTDGTITPNLEYSKNGVDWTLWDYSWITVTTSGIKLRGINNTPISNEENYFQVRVNSTNFADVNVRGNIMSLVDGEGRTTTIPADNMFAYLFKGIKDNTYWNYNVEIRATQLKLPATTLTRGCYKYMFADTGLITPPKKLPAKVLKYGCYESMFENTEIYFSPVLMGEVLVGNEYDTGCYKRMFYSCNDLEKVYCFNTDWEVIYGESEVNCEEKHFDTLDWMVSAGSNVTNCNRTAEYSKCQFYCIEDTFCVWDSLLRSDRDGLGSKWVVCPINFNYFKLLV